jgi:alpha-glucan,water dikinase
LDKNLTVQQKITSEENVERKQEIKYEIEFINESNEEDLVLHWGLSYAGKSGWIAPGQDSLPYNTKVFDSKAVQTKFSKDKIILINLLITDENNLIGLNYVFYLPTKNKWYNNNNKDYSIKLKTLKSNLKRSDMHTPEFVDEIIKCEMEYGSWTLMHRYNKCLDLINSFDLEESNLLWIYIWLRFSYLKVLDWQRSFNTKPRELAYSMSRLTSDITYKFSQILKSNKENPAFVLSSDILLRMCLSLLGKGTGDGQKIRDEILQILHKHHIKETNDHFYEQWHQKLHNNTTPDDIVICEALLAYLKSNGDLSTYWKILNKGRVTKERLAAFERRIVSEPFYKPELIPDLEHFLQTLKAVHSSDDMVLMFESSKYAFNGSDYIKFHEIINLKDDWDSLKQINRVTEGRSLLNKIILGTLNDTNKIRDLVFFDLSLEAYLRQLVEKIIHINLDFEHYISEVTAISKNIYYSYNFREIRLCLEDWTSICENLKQNISKNTDYSGKAALKIKSVSDRMSRTLSHIVDYFNTYYEPKAKYLGNSFHAEKFLNDIFTEETVRGSIFFTLSMILKKIEPILRKVANLGPLLVISRGKADIQGVNGYISYVKSLQEVQFKVFEKPTILLTQQVGGNEEIPANVFGLIILQAKDYPDVLAHVSVRARNLGVPFIVLFDDITSENLLKMVDKYVNLKLIRQNLDVVELSDSSFKCNFKYTEDEYKTYGSNKKIQSVKIPDGYPSIILQMHEFSKEFVGAKSNNTKKVFGNLPTWVKYPESLAIPFNVCEHFLEAHENQHIREKLVVN